MGENGISTTQQVLADIEPILSAARADSAADELGRVLPHHHVVALRKAGFGGLRVPTQHGGGGVSLVELLDVVIEVAAADSNLAHIWRNHFAVVETLRRGATAAAQARWFTEITDGTFFTTGMSERDANTPAGGGDLLTQITYRDGQLVINGAKYYSTGSLYADWALVRTGWQGDRVNVIVDLHAPGVTVDDDWDGFGQRVSGSGSLVLDNVRVSPEDVVVQGRPGGQYGGAFAQLYLTTILAGITRAIADEAAALVTSRTRNYYHAPAVEPRQDPLLQLVVGELASNAFVARAAVLEAARALDLVATNTSGPDVEDLARRATLAAAHAKVVLDNLVTSSATRLFDAGGASASARGRNLDRHWRNARTLVSHNPTAHKARVLGDYVLNATPLPTGGFF